MEYSLGSIMRREQLNKRRFKYRCLIINLFLFNPSSLLRISEVRYWENRLSLCIYILLLLHPPITDR